MWQDRPIRTDEEIICFQSFYVIKRVHSVKKTHRGTPFKLVFLAIERFDRFIRSTVTSTVRSIRIFFLDVSLACPSGDGA